ncbi:MAG: hypothetical protein ABIK92_06475 [Pseudomonadota bacterium]
MNEELYFVFYGNNENLFITNKLENIYVKGQGQIYPAEYIKNELKKKPGKLVCDGEIIGEVRDYDTKSGGLNIFYYDKPIPIITESDSDELE